MNLTKEDVWWLCYCCYLAEIEPSDALKAAAKKYLENENKTN